MAKKTHCLEPKGRVSARARREEKAESGGVTFLKRSMKRISRHQWEKIPPAIPAEKKDLSSQYPPVLGGEAVIWRCPERRDEDRLFDGGGDTTEDKGEGQRRKMERFG